MRIHHTAGKMRRLLAVLISAVLLIGNTGAAAYAANAQELIEAEEPASVQSLTEAEEPANAQSLTGAEEPASAQSLTEAEDPLNAQDLAEGGAAKVGEMTETAADDPSGAGSVQEELTDAPDAQEADVPEEVMEDVGSGEALAGDGPELTMPLEYGWYNIADVDDWYNLVDYVAGGGDTRGKKFALKMHFACPAAIGTEENPFRGTFDGYNRLISYVPKDVAGIADGLFRYAEDARFVDVRIEYRPKPGAASAGALVGSAAGNVEIEGCAAMYDNRDNGSGSGGIYGGFVGTGAAGSRISLTGCVVSDDLRISGADRFGGFVGWSDGEVSIQDCFFAPDTIEVDAAEKSVLFGGGASLTVENAYYAAECGNVNDGAVRACRITGGEGAQVTPDYGSRKASYSTIYERYDRGIFYKRPFSSNTVDRYAISGADIPLAIEYTGTGALYGYTASAGLLSGSGTSYTLSMPGEDVVITPEEGLALTVDGSVHGTVTVDAACYNEDGLVMAGAVVRVTATPDAGYAVDEIKYNDTVLVPSDGMYSFVMPGTDVTVTASFKQYHSVTLGEGTEHAGITLSGDTYARGDTVTLTAAPDEGYVIECLYMNGTEFAAEDGVYSFVMPDEDAVITVSYKPYHSVSIGEGTEYADITVSGDTFVEGDTVTVTVSKKGTGHVLVSLRYNGTEMEAEDGIYSFVMPAEDVTIDAIFEEGYEIRVADGIENGSVRPEVSHARAGERVTVTVSPAFSYVLEYLCCNGEDIPDEDGAYRFTMPASDAVITAGFYIGGKCGENLFWELEDRCLAITGTGEMTSAPWRNWDGAIYRDVESLELPDGLTGICDYAFLSCTMREVVIPNSVTQIGQGAFMGCYCARSIKLPDNLEEIKCTTFERCTALTAIEIPDSVKTIEYEAMRDCTKLASVTLPAGLTDLGENVFEYNVALTAIDFNGAQVRIPNWAFNNCRSLVTVSGIENITGIGDYAFYECASLKDFTVPEGAKEIGTRAFFYCTGLENLLFENGVETIGEYAFYHCISLTAIELPESIVTLAPYAFIDCTKIETVRLPDNLESIGIGNFDLNYALKNINFPKNLKNIGHDAFSSCSSLTRADIPEGVKTVDDTTFNYCYKMEDVYFYGTDFGGYTFSTTAFGSTKRTVLHILYFIDPETLTPADGAIYRWYMENPASVINDIDLPGYHRVITDGIIGGTVEADAYVEEGETVTLNVAADEGFAFESIEADGGIELTENADGTWSFTMPARDVVITAEFTVLDGYYEVSIAEPENGRIVPDRWAAREGETVTLAAYPDPGYESGTLLVDGGHVEAAAADGGGWSFTMPAREVEVRAAFIQMFEQMADEEGIVYVIRDSSHWEKLAAYVAADRDRPGMRFLLADDIETSVMVGSDSHTFDCSFDGGGHTVTVDYADDGNTNAAPFRSIKNASFRNLHVAGRINTGRKFAAGLIGTVKGNTYIENCVSSVSILSTVSGDGTHGGFIGLVQGEGTIEITGCLFNGELLGEETSNCGGFIGWADGRAAISDSVAAPCLVTMGSDGSALFSRGNGDIAISNCYYLEEFWAPNAGALRAYSITPGDGIAIVIRKGDVVSSFDTGSLEFYGEGFTLGGEFYSAQGKEPVLDITYTGQGRGNSIHASAGTLSQEGGSYRLTMPGEDVVILSAYGIASGTMPDYAGWDHVPAAAEEGDMFTPVLLIDPEAWNAGCRPEAVIVTDSRGGMTEISRTASGEELFTAGATTGSNGKRCMEAEAFPMPGSDVALSARFTFSGPTTWAGLQARLLGGGTITLTQDITAGAGESALTVPAGVTAILDLNGHAVDRALTSPTPDGYVIRNLGTLTIRDSSAEETGTVTGGYSDGSAGGIFSEEASLTLEGGAISGNKAREFAGVYATDGTFTMTGGRISGNEAYASTGGGVGCITYFDMTGGEISGNTAKTDGGGVYNIGVFTMTGGEVSGNTAQNGGGLYLQDGVASASGGTITGNTAHGTGGGVHLGIVDSWYSLDPEFRVEGAPVVRGNVGGNLYVGNGNTVIAAGAFTEGAELHVSMEDGTGTFTTGYSEKNKAFPSAYFHADDPSKGIVLDGDEAALSQAVVNNIPYVERSWNGERVIATDATCNVAKPVPADGSMTSGWYYLGSNVTVNGRVSLKGDTSLILGDGFTLDVKGLYVPKGSTLAVYAQSDDARAGKIYSHPTGGGAGIGATRDNHPGGDIVIHGGSIEAEGDDNCAGIGGNDGNEKDIGSFTMYGGMVKATGGDAGAGIGGGAACEGGVITIYDGTVIAEGGHYGAGIGGGNGKDTNPLRGAHGGTITIWGGTVTAKGGDDGAGIGGGEGGNAGTITIHGGTVTAKGGNNSAGIGGGEGESTGKGGTVTIDGGTVTATGGDDGAGIGGGEDGYCDSITISGGVVTANGGRQAAAIGGGNNVNSGAITISGGRVTANANSDNGYGIGSGHDCDGRTPVTLGYTDETYAEVRVRADSFRGTVTLEKPFTDGTTVYAAGRVSNNQVLAGKTLTAATEREAVIIKSANVNFRGQLELRFTLTFPDSALADPGTIVSVNSAGMGTKWIPLFEGTADGNDVRFTLPIPAPEFADEVSIRAYSGDIRVLPLYSGGGTDYTLTGFNYSVRTYAANKMANGTTQEMRDLAKALLDYGTAAQIYFRYGDFEGLSVGDDVLAVTEADLGGYAHTTEGTKPAGVDGAAMAVEFVSDNTLRVTFKLATGKSASDYTFLLDGAEATPGAKKNAAFLEVRNIAASNLDKVHAFTVTDGTDAYTVNASALSYALTSIRNGTPERQNLGKALFLYNQAANAMFES